MRVDHELKVHPQFWDDLQSFRKPFEIRRNDRKFKAGDVLRLREWNPSSGCYGDDCYRRVTYVLHHEDFPIGLRPGFVCLGLEKIDG